MWYQIAAEAVMSLHLLYIVFSVFGAVLALWWRWVPWLQLPCAAWAFFVMIAGAPCPLTDIENHFRLQAGQAGMAPGGFIEHYLLAVIYPAGLTRELQYLLGALVLGFNGLIYAWVWRRWRRRPAAGCNQGVAPPLGGGEAAPAPAGAATGAGGSPGQVRVMR